MRTLQHITGRRYKLMKAARGSNGSEIHYMIRIKKHTNANMYRWLSLYGIFVSVVFLGKIGYNTATHTQEAMISPLAANAATITPKPTVTKTPMTPTLTPVPSTPTPTYTPDQEKIDAEIKTVFGGYYNKAMLILKGDGKVGSCHENGGLNPAAINTNYDKATGKALSKDYGVFQINDMWQGVTNTTFLTDYTINIRMAWSIFTHNNYTFDKWTCGKYYGI